MSWKFNLTALTQCLAVLLLALGILIHPLAVHAVGDILVMGLFRDKALLLVDGKRHFLSTGERTPEGVKLVEANSRRAVLEVHGQRSVHTLGSRVSASFAKKQVQRVQIYKNHRGLFTTVGSINGLPVQFMVDTGASAVALNRSEASRLGIPYLLEGEKIYVRTASGGSKAYAVKLDSVKLGEITQRNVDAFVVDGEEPHTVLLGMSYLQRVSIKNDGQVMILEQKY